VIGAAVCTLELRRRQLGAWVKHGVSGAARYAALAERRRGCSVGIREFRAGLAEIISSRQPAACRRKR
jgi:hypothetical protein